MPGQGQETYLFGKFRLSPSRHTLTRDDVEVPLTPKSFEVLVYLARNPGRVVTKEELLKAVWQDAFIEEANLAQQIFRLRKAFEADPEAASLILTIPGRGYQLTAEVRSESAMISLAPPTSSLEIEGWRERTRVIVEELAVRDGTPLLAGRVEPKKHTWSLVAAVCVVAGVGGWFWHRHHVPAHASQVVVADFVNTTGDATFDHMLNRALEIDLSQSPYMDVLSEREAVSTLQLMDQKPDAVLTPELARQVCVRTNRQALLTGSVAHVGNEYLLTLEASDCNSGRELAAAKTEAGSKEKVLAAVDSLADIVRAKLGETSASVEKYQVPAAVATTPSLEALKAYSTAGSLVAQGVEERQAITFYEKAIELDPKFAMAYNGLGTMYANLAEKKLARQAYAKAYALSEPVSEKEKLNIQAHYFLGGEGDISSGIHTYQMWTVTYPNDWVPFLNLATEDIVIGQYAPAVPYAKRALELMPNRAITYSVYTRSLARMNRFAEAKAVGRLAVQKDKDNAGLHGTLFSIATAENDKKAIATEKAWAANSTDEWYQWYFSYCQAEVASSAGKVKEAEQLFKNSAATAIDQKSAESADGVLADEAQMELDLGLPALAKATLDRMANQDSDEPDLAVIRARLGDLSAAERFITLHSKENSGSDFVLLKLPRVRAAVAMAKGKPQEAVAALDSARPYELATYDVLSQRGAIYLAMKDGAAAELQYKKILANPGIDPVMNLYNLAHLGLARAYALQNKSADALHEYETFLTLWHDADPDLPLLKQVRVEYTTLSRR